MSLRKIRHRNVGSGQAMLSGRRDPRAPTGWPLHRAWGLTQTEEGQAESMSVSIETTTAQGRALGRTGTGVLSLLPVPWPGVGVKPHVQTRVPWHSWQHLGLRASSGCQILCQLKERVTVAGSMCCALSGVGGRDR